jgi:hypothetical protein
MDQGYRQQRGPVRPAAGLRPIRPDLHPRHVEFDSMPIYQRILNKTTLHSPWKFVRKSGGFDFVAYPSAVCRSVTRSNHGKRWPIRITAAAIDRIRSA